MFKTYKKILFDLDNTLIDDDENRRYAFKQVLLNKNGKSSKEEIERFINLDNKFWSDRAKGKIKAPYKFKNNDEKTRWVRSKRFMDFFSDITFEEAAQINNYYINNLGKIVLPIDNAKEILEYLYNKNYQIYIVTNGPLKAVDDKLNGIKSKEYIEEIFSAEEAGSMKPNDVFFEKFFEKIKVNKKDDMLIVGDELEKDVLGGNLHGIDSCWFNSKNEPNSSNIKPTYEINNLIELKKFL